MGKEKAGFLTPKAIANRIKAKGLQKLRWYCQMCQKQCRDQNGFTKCHIKSESHQRQMLLFAENPDQYIDDFSKEFMDGYLELLRRRFGTKRVHCNIVYQEHIAFREHSHMNGTRWESLTEFVKWLGREGKCVVDNTENGWFIQYIDRDPETIKKQEQIKAKEKMDMDDEERTAVFIQKQIERAAEQGTSAKEVEYTELKRENEEEKVSLSFSGLKPKKKEENSVLKSDNPLSSKKPAEPEKPKKRESRWEKEEPRKEVKKDAFKPPKPGEKRKSALDEIMEFEEKKKEKTNRKDYWLTEGIVVKIITKKLGEKFHKKKAVVKEVQDLYKAVIETLDSGNKVRVDQNHLETVIPAHGKLVKILNGAYRGHDAVLEGIDEKKFCCTVSIHSGPLKGRVVENIQFEDISKVF